MKKILMKIISLITAFAVFSSGTVYAYDYDETYIDSSGIVFRIYGTNGIGGSHSAILKGYVGEDPDVFIPRVATSANTVNSIYPGAFKNIDWITSVEFDSRFYEVGFIGASAFSGCTSLSVVKLPISTVSKDIIQDAVFKNCSSLSSIENLDKVNYISSYAFDGCSSLAEVTLTYLKSIGEYGFRNCSKLSSIEIPKIEIIGKYAFAGCSSLSEIEIPYTTRSIYSPAFYDCKSLTSVNVAENNPYYKSKDGILYNINETDLLYYPMGKTEVSFAVPDNVTSIGSFAFDGCSALTEVALPKGLQVIDHDAFGRCEALTSIDFPISLETIGDNAFIGCDSLTEVEIPYSVSSIGYGPFSACKSLTNINVNSKNLYYTSKDGILYNIDETDLICYPAGKPETSFIIPDGITTIGRNAFFKCGLTSVEIPDSVRTIDRQAFYECDLTSIKIPDSVTKIDNAAFQNCQYLTSVIISNGVEELGDYAFNSEALSYVIVPESVTSIGTDAFTRDTVIYVVKGSYAETYARDNHLNFEYIEDFPTDTDSSDTNDPTDTSDPSDTSDPTDTSNPSDTSDPSDTSEPSDTSNPSDTSEPSDTSDPSDTPEPSDTSNPSDTSEPSDTSDPSDTSEPSDTSDPSDTSEPSDTSAPSDTSEAVDPVPPVRQSCTVGDFTIYYTDNDTTLTVIGAEGRGENLLIPREIDGKPVKVLTETALSGAAGISAIYIPSSVTAISDNPFNICPLLTDIYYGGTENRWYTTAAGIAFENGELNNVTLHFNVKGIFNNEPTKEVNRSIAEAAYRFNISGYIPTVYMEGNEAAITKEALEYVKTAFSPIALKTESCAFTIAPNGISEPADFKIAVKSADGSDNIGHWVDPANAFMIIPVQPSEGDFGLTVDVVIPETALPFYANSELYLYHVDDSDNIEDYSNYLSYNGDSVSAALSHASKYFITAVKVNINGESTDSDRPDPTQSSEPTKPTEPAQSSEPTPPAVTTAPAGMFVVPNITNGTTAVLNTTAPITNTGSVNAGNSVFVIEFETEASVTAVTNEITAPSASDVISEGSTTVPPISNDILVNTNKPVDEYSNTQISSGASAENNDKQMNTGDSTLPLTPLMLISAAAVFGGTFISVKQKDK